MADKDEISNRVSIIGVTISCSATGGSEGLDGSPDKGKLKPKSEKEGKGGAKRQGPKSDVPWFLWISFQLPSGVPAQLEIPMFGSDQTPEGQRGDNNREASARIKRGLAQAKASGRHGTPAEFDGIEVSIQDAPQGKGDRRDYLVKILIPNAKSIDGASDSGKIRVGGIAGNHPVGGSVGLRGPPKLRYRPTEIVPLPYPTNVPWGEGENTFPCWPLPRKKRSKPKRKKLQGLEEQSETHLEKFTSTGGWKRV